MDVKATSSRSMLVHLVAAFVTVGCPVILSLFLPVDSPGIRLRESGVIYSIEGNQYLMIYFDHTLFTWCVYAFVLSLLVLIAQATSKYFNVIFALIVSMQIVVALAVVVLLPPKSRAELFERLLIAYQHGDREAGALLVCKFDSGYVLDTGYLSEVTVISEAARQDDIYLIRQAVAMGASVKAANSLGWAPIFYAAGSNGKEFGGINSMRTLHELGADISAIDVAGLSPLYWAIRYALWDRAELLMSWGADLESIEPEDSRMENRLAEFRAHIGLEEGG